MRDREQSWPPPPPPPPPPGEEAFPVLGQLQREGAQVDSYWADSACIEERTPGQSEAERIKVPESLVPSTSPHSPLFPSLLLLLLLPPPSLLLLLPLSPPSSSSLLLPPPPSSLLPPPPPSSSLLLPPDIFLQASRESSGWKGLYFGGVAFKAQRLVADELVGKAAAIATRYMDVVTSSGRATGEL